MAARAVGAGVGRRADAPEVSSPNPSTPRTLISIHRWPPCAAPASASGPQMYPVLARVVSIRCLSRCCEPRSDSVRCTPSSFKQHPVPVPCPRHIELQWSQWSNAAFLGSIGPDLVLAPPWERLESPSLVPLVTVARPAAPLLSSPACPRARPGATATALEALLGVFFDCCSACSLGNGTGD